MLANRRWARAVAKGIAPEVAMDDLSDEEWLAAVKTHPRIGERGGIASQREQSTALRASPETLGELAAENRKYEAKFGHVFLIAASGRSAEEILAEMRRRMKNDRTTEFEEAKRELRRIVGLRLESL